MPAYVVLNRGGQRLDDLICWKRVWARIDSSKLVKIRAGAKLAQEHLPDPPTGEKAVRSAVREAAVGQPEGLIRPGKEDDAGIVYPIVREIRWLNRSRSHLRHRPTGSAAHFGPL